MDIFIWKQLLKNLVLPPTGPLVLAVVGLALWAGARSRGARGWLRGVGPALCAAGVMLLWALSTPIVADSLMRAAERYPALDLGKPIDAQAIVILAGGVRPGAPEYGGHPAPNSTTLQRLVYGARVAHATGLPVLVSGSHYEAEAMNDFLRSDLSVTPRWVENHSRDTRQNALMSAAILERAGIHKVVLVTSSEHMARAVTEFRTARLAVVPAPAEMWTRRDHALLVWVPNAEALLRSQRALYEVLGRIVQSVRLDFAAAPAPGRT
ncbi:MAG: YdcF family protein [Steroidobacteraceae bacterium]